MRFKVILLYIVIIIAILSLITLTYAFFQNDKKHPIQLQLGELTVDAYISFNGTYIDHLSPYYETSTQTVIVDAHDSSKMNYIEYLKIEIVVTPKIASKLRVLVKDEWILTRTFNPDSMYPMEPVVESIYFPKQNDIYYPYSYLKKGFNEGYKFHTDGYLYKLSTLQKNETVTFTLIDGGRPYLVRENDLYVETCVIRIGLVVELVQANRYHEVWGIDTSFYTP